MKFDVRKDDSTVTLTLHERKLDSTLASELKAEFLLICTPKVTTLVVDMTAVEFCDSSGLSALLIADRKMKEHDGVVKLRNVHKKVLSLLHISMIDRVFEIESHPHKRS
jgi:anti-anti-sigma factor